MMAYCARFDIAPSANNQGKRILNGKPHISYIHLETTPKITSCSYHPSLIIQPPKITLVLMAGFPGTGKTTLARNLERKICCKVIYKDEIKKDFMDKGFSDNDAAKRAYDQAFLEAIISLTVEKRSVILDSSAMQYFVWERAQKLAHNFNIDLKVLHCIVDNDVRMQRLRKRDASISQQNARTFTSEADPAQFSHLPQNTFTIDTKNPSEDYLLATISYLMT